MTHFRDVTTTLWYYETDGVAAVRILYQPVLWWRPRWLLKELQVVLKCNNDPKCYKIRIVITDPKLNKSAWVVLKKYNKTKNITTFHLLHLFCYSIHHFLHFRLFCINFINYSNSALQTFTYVVWGVICTQYIFLRDYMCGKGDPKEAI